MTQYVYLIFDGSSRPVGERLKEVASLIEKMRKQGYEPCNMRPVIPKKRWLFSPSSPPDNRLYFRRPIEQEQQLSFSF